MKESVVVCSERLMGHYSLCTLDNGSGQLLWKHSEVIFVVNVNCCTSPPCLKLCGKDAVYYISTMTTQTSAKFLYTRLYLRNIKDYGALTMWYLAIELNYFK